MIKYQVKSGKLRLESGLEHSTSIMVIMSTVLMCSLSASQGLLQSVHRTFVTEPPSGVNYEHAVASLECCQRRCTSFNAGTANPFESYTTNAVSGYRPAAAADAQA